MFCKYVVLPCGLLQVSVCSPSFPLIQAHSFPVSSKSGTPTYIYNCDYICRHSPPDVPVAQWTSLWGI